MEIQREASKNPNDLLLDILGCIDLCSVWLLKQQCNTVHHKNEERHDNSRRLAVPQSGAQETQSQSIVHRVVVDIEGEGSDSLLHQNAKVVTQVRSCDTKRPHGGQYKNVSKRESDNCQCLHELGVQQWRVGGLFK